MGNCSVSSKAAQYNSRSDAPGSAVGSIEHACMIHDGPVLGLCYADAKTLISCGDDRKIAVTNLSDLMGSKSYVPKYLLGHSKAVNRVQCFNSQIWSTSRDLSIRMWKAETAENVKVISNAHELNIMAITQSRFGQGTVVSGSRDYSVKQWDIESGECTASYSTPRNIVTTLEASPVHAALLYQGSEDLFIRVWDLRAASGTGPVQAIAGFVYFPVSMSVHPDGNLLATGCKGFDGVGCTVKLWDLRNTALPVTEYTGHNQDVVGCAFSSQDPDLLISTSKDGSVRVWDTTAAAPTEGAKATAFASIPHSGKLNSCLAVPQGPTEDSAIGKSEQQLAAVRADSSSLEGNIVAVGAMDGSITLAELSREHGSGSSRGKLSAFCTTAAPHADAVAGDDT